MYPYFIDKTEGSLSEEEEETEDPKKRKRLVKMNDQKTPRTRSAAAPGNPDPKVAIKGRLDNMFGSDDQSDATPEINGNGDSSGDDVQKWAEVDEEETDV